jgi:myo-inositol-1(or 4)-monophosphatase
MFPLLNQKIPLTPREDDLRRIARALGAAKDMAFALRSDGVTPQFKTNNDPVTIMDQALDHLLRNSLPNGDEGWLSEETADDRSRLEKHRVWIVDPLDGTREFVAGIPEWCISIGLVEDGRAVAGGICNPATGQMFLGSIETGLIVAGHLPSVEPNRGALGSRQPERSKPGRMETLRRCAIRCSAHGFCGLQTGAGRSRNG